MAIHHDRLGTMLINQEASKDRQRPRGAVKAKPWMHLYVEGYHCWWMKEETVGQADTIVQGLPNQKRNELPLNFRFGGGKTADVSSTRSAAASSAKGQTASSKRASQAASPLSSNRSSRSGNQR